MLPKIFIGCLYLIMSLSSIKTYCQTSPLCPKYDSTHKAWAFVDCKTQKQVFAAEYRQATKNYNEASKYGKQPYFWSEFDKDSLIILDSIGNSLMAVSKQDLPLIEYLAVENPELVEITWKDSTKNMGISRMLILKNEAWKSALKSNLNVYIAYLDNVGNDNYIAHLVKKINIDSTLNYGQLLLDKKYNPLSKVYSYMFSNPWDDTEPIQVTNKETHKMGYIDFNGKIIIPELYNNTIHSYFENNFIILQLNGKYGVLDINNKIILPFAYHEIRQLKNGFFVVRDAKGLSNEYVVNTKGKSLTEPVFCQIDSFAGDKVWQKWSNKTLFYNSQGKCLSSEQEIEEAGFMVFLQDTKTKTLYSQYVSIPNTIKEFEVILHTSNMYSYKVLQGHLTCRGGRTFRKIIDGKIKFYDSDIILFREVLNLEKLSIKNTKTGKEKVADELYHIVLFSFYKG